MESFRASEARAELLAQLRPVSSAWSLNGRDVGFLAGFELGAEVGGFLTVELNDGERVLVQVHELSTGIRDAIRVDVDAEELGLTESGVTSANVGVVVRFVEGTGVVLGTVDDPSAAVAPFSDGTIAISQPADVAGYFDTRLGDKGSLRIGTLQNGVDARLKSSGFARHTFMCGQSGAGKTYALGAILERLLVDTDLPVVIVDPNSDYVKLGEFRSRAALNRGPWSFAREEYDSLRGRYEDRVDIRVASAHNGDLPLRIHLSDLEFNEQALTLGLDPHVNGDEYAVLRTAIDELADTSYSFDDIIAVLTRRFDDASRRLVQRIANLGVASWSVWAAADEASLADRGLGGRALVLDTGSLPDARERSVIALALLGRLRRRPERSPIGVVIDEAHNVCAPDADSPLERAISDHAVWIAGEGRKFGIYLALSTQRPQKIHRNVISQCDNLLLMRMNSRDDLDELAQVFSHVPAAMVAESRTFGLGEMIAAGPIAQTPMRLRIGARWTKEGGSDLPTSWTQPSD